MAIVDVVKYNGEPGLLAWKFPEEELGTWTQLIVNESQEAVLFRDGRAMDVFGAGRHTLETQNIPILNKIINLPFGGRSPFAAEVWYVNKLSTLDVKWGTPSPIQMQDSRYRIFVPVRANGMFGIRVEDAMKFLVKLVGTMPAFDRNMLVNHFRGLCVTKVKDALSSYLLKKQISVMEINAYIDELSGYMKERIEPDMAEYGIKLINFYVNEISVPEDDPSVKKLKDALAKKAEMDIIGFDYRQERSLTPWRERLPTPDQPAHCSWARALVQAWAWAWAVQWGQLLERSAKKSGPKSPRRVRGRICRWHVPAVAERYRQRGVFVRSAGRRWQKNVPNVMPPLTAIPDFARSAGRS